MKPTLSGRWAETPSSQRREPTSPEIANGFPCGPWDQALFNELMFRLTDLAAEAGNVITGSGLSLSASDAEQLLRAIRSQRSNFVAAAGVGGTANAITLACTPAYGSVGSLLFSPIRFTFEAANTAPMAVNVDGLGLIDLRWADNTVIGNGEAFAGLPAIIFHDGTNFKLFTPLSPSKARAQSFKRTLTTYLTAGSFTYTTPAGVQALEVEGVASGGGGGCGLAGTPGGGAAGGGAGASGRVVLDVIAGDTLEMTIPAGGTGGTNAIAATAGANLTILHKRGGSTLATLTLAGGAAASNAAATIAGNSVTGGTTGGGWDQVFAGEPSTGGIIASVALGGRGGGARQITIAGIGGLAGAGNGNPGNGPGAGGGGGGGTSGSFAVGGNGAAGGVAIRS